MKPMRDFDLEIYFSKWEFNARYNIGGSDLESMSLKQLLELADDGDRREWDNLYLGYTETYGLPSLREVIAATYDNLSADHVLCFVGAEEGIFCAMHAILGPDDHALVCYPNYQSAETVPLGICKVTGIPLDPDENWSLDLDLVRSEIRPNTKLISVNFPNNPTGKILERDKFDHLVNICRERGIYLFSDEVYRLLERDESRRLPQAADIYERALSLNVMSKAYGLAGLRLGWIASQDTELLQSMERIKHYLTICGAGPSEILAKIALKARDKILTKNRALIERNLNHLNAFFGRFSDLFDWCVPDGSAVGFPRYKGPEGVEAFTARLVDETGVLLVPAGVYRSKLGRVPSDRCRFGYGRSFLPEALDILAEYLEKRAA